MVSQQVLVQKYFAGPLPSPEVLGEYEAAFPGLADRIVKMAEDRHEMAKAQSEHRQRMEASVVAANIVSERLGSMPTSSNERRSEADHSRASKHGGDRVVLVECSDYRAAQKRKR